MSVESTFDKASGAEAEGPLSPQPSTSAGLTQSGDFTWSTASTSSANTKPAPASTSFVSIHSEESSSSNASTSTSSEPDRPSVSSNLQRLDGGIQEFRVLSRRRRLRFRALKCHLAKNKNSSPNFLRESQRLRHAHILVSVTIEHFADTVTGIVDNFGGKSRETADALKLKRSKKRKEAGRAKRARLNSPPAEEKPPKAETVATAATAEEVAKEKARALRLKMEAHAAVEALSLGDDARGEGCSEPPPVIFSDSLAVPLVTLFQHIRNNTESDGDD